MKRSHSRRDLEFGTKNSQRRIPAKIEPLSMLTTIQLNNSTQIFLHPPTPQQMSSNIMVLYSAKFSVRPLLPVSWKSGRLKGEHHRYITPPGDAAPSRLLQVCFQFFNFPLGIKREDWWWVDTTILQHWRSNQVCYSRSSKHQPMRSPQCTTLNSNPSWHAMTWWYCYHNEQSTCHQSIVHQRAGVSRPDRTNIYSTTKSSPQCPEIRN